MISFKDEGASQGEYKNLLPNLLETHERNNSVGIKKRKHWIGIDLEHTTCTNALRSLTHIRSLARLGTLSLIAQLVLSPIFLLSFFTL